MTNSTEIEQSLSQLSYLQLQDEHPELMNYLVGFQLVDQKDEGTRAIGIMVFNVHGKHYFMPVLFINGFIKPMIILFDYELKVFIPATSEIVKHITRPTNQNGFSVVEKDEHFSAMSRPNLHQFSLTPLLSKGASETKPILSHMWEIMKAAPQHRVKSASFRELLRKSSAELKYLLSDALLNDREMLEKIALKYPGYEDDLQISEVREVNATTPDEKDLLEIKQVPLPHYSPEENAKLYKGELIVDDKRPRTAQVYFKQSGQNFSGVDTNGEYQVIGASGTFRRLFCFTNAIYERGMCGCDYERSEIFAVDPAEKKAFKVDRKNVHAMIPGKGLDDFYSETIPITDLEIEKTYMIVNPEIMQRPNGCITEPICISGKMLSTSNLLTYMTCYGKIKVMPRGSQEMFHQEDEHTIFVSPDVRAYEVERAYGPDCNNFGTFSDLMRQMHSKMVDEVVISNDGLEFKISDGKEIKKKASYNDSLIYLMKEKGIHFDTATEMMQKQGSYLLRKEATSIRANEEPYVEVNSGILPSQKTYPLRLESEVNQLKKPDIYQRTTIEQDLATARGAMGRGEQDIVDSSLVGVLANSENDIERLKEMIPIMKQYAHNMGVLLLKIWWNPQSFEEEYTVDDLHELEQAVKDSFTKAGNIALSIILRKKLVGQDA